MQTSTIPTPSQTEFKKVLKEHLRGFVTTGNAIEALYYKGLAANKKWLVKAGA